jgi:hypothetical protein
MPNIFISYRRNDSAELTRRLHERLEHEFESGSAFYDIDSIPPGVDFRNRLIAALEQADVLLAVIGIRWLNETYADGARQGKRRLDYPDDYVRIEIESALSVGVPIIPVLVDGAAMPTEAELPAGLKELAYRNAAEVRSGPHFNQTVDRLIHNVKELITDEQELWNSLKRSKEVAAKDPESGLNCARRLLQRVVREVFERRTGEPAGMRSLQKIVECLVDGWYLPKEFDLSALLPKNGINHPATSTTSAEAERALTQLADVLKWYTEVERPNRTAKLPAPRRHPESTTVKISDLSPVQPPAVTLNWKSRFALGSLLIVLSLPACFRWFLAESGRNDPPLKPPTQVPSPIERVGNPVTKRLIRALESIQSTGLPGNIYTEIIVERPNGRYEVVPDGGQIRTKIEPYRIYVYAPSDGYLYVCQVDASDRVNWLFPKNESEYSYGRNPVKGGNRLMIPDNDNGLKLDEVRGKESVIVIYSPEKWEELENQLRTTVKDEYSASPPEQPVRVRVGVRDDSPRGVGGETPFAGAKSLADLEEQMYRQAKTISANPGIGRMVETRWFEHIE